MDEKKREKADDPKKSLMDYLAGREIGKIQT